MYVNKLNDFDIDLTFRSVDDLPSAGSILSANEQTTAPANSSRGSIEYENALLSRVYTRIESSK